MSGQWAWAGSLLHASATARPALTPGPQYAARRAPSTPESNRCSRAQGQRRHQAKLTRRQPVSGPPSRARAADQLVSCTATPNSRHKSELSDGNADGNGDAQQRTPCPRCPNETKIIIQLLSVFSSAMLAAMNTERRTQPRLSEKLSLSRSQLTIGTKEDHIKRHIAAAPSVAQRK